MADADSRPDADESSDATTDSGEAGVSSPRACHETVDAVTRDEVLRDYWYRCQVCGRCGPERGGLATLHVHHIERDPDGMGEHDRENLTVLCLSCPSWFHQQSTPADSPVEITEADRSSASGDGVPGDPDAQQRLDAVADQRADTAGQPDTRGAAGPEPDSQAAAQTGDASAQAVNNAGSDADLESRLQRAIAALREVDDEL